jgi:TM2 domain-containing membrane protein YozV
VIEKHFYFVKLPINICLYLEVYSVLGNKSKPVGYLLAFFLGGLGGHAFYYRRYVRGVLYLILCWTYIPIILGWIDMLFINKWHKKLQA